MARTLLPSSLLFLLCAFLLVNKAANPRILKTNGWLNLVRKIIIALILPPMLAGCSSPTPTPAPFANEITFYDWREDMPQSVLDAFTAEYGIQVNYLTYESQEEAIENIKAGQTYDVVVLESRYIPQLIQEKLLAKLDQRNLDNTKNLSANFRELAYDPGNRYSLPYNWGTTGLVVRSDLVAEPVTRWADLWDSRYAGRTAYWFGEPREIIGLTLKSLGYSANSETPEELEAALARLLELKPTIIQIEDPKITWPDDLANGKIILAMGYASDLLKGQALNSSITYVLPKEGALLWNDTFTIPANSPKQVTAELFLNFLMRAKINAQIVNENLYATPNEVAFPFINADISSNAAIFPSNNDLVNAELITPLSPEGQKLFDEIWQRYEADP